MAVTADSASNNRTMCIALTKILPAFQGTKSYVQCFAHILNLIVMVIVCLCLSCPTLLTSYLVSKAILSPFVAKKAKSGNKGQPVGAVEDLELEELLEGIECNEDDEEDEAAIDGQDKDHLEADNALIEEVIDMPNYTIDVNDAKEDIRMGKLSMSKVRELVHVIRSEPEYLR